MRKMDFEAADMILLVLIIGFISTTATLSMKIEKSNKDLEKAFELMENQTRIEGYQFEIQVKEEEVERYKEDLKELSLEYNKLLQKKEEE